MLIEGREELVAGPYDPPRVRPGDWLPDEIDGLVKVGGYSRGPIPWPRRHKTGRASLILCGDLVRAVRTESALAITAHFGVGAVTVAKWRAALGVDRKSNAGTRRLYETYQPHKLPDDAAERGRAGASAPDARARMAATKTGKPAHPNTRAALARAAARPKGPEWGRRANAWMQAAKAKKDT